MLKQISVKKGIEHLQSGETLEYLKLPDGSYNELKLDFKLAPHFMGIDQLDLKEAGGVIIKCSNVTDGLMAANYLYKKYEAVAKPQYDLVEENEDDEFPAGMEPYHPSDDEEETDSELSAILYKNGELLGLPTIDSVEFNNAFSSSEPLSNGFANYQMKWGEEQRASKPYWYYETFPLIVVENHRSFNRPSEAFKKTKRLIIYISIEMENGINHYVNHDQWEQKILFECDYELCNIEKPTKTYYQQVLTDCAHILGYKISKKIDKEKLIDDLMSYRGGSFASNLDIDLLVSKTIKKKKDHSKTLTKANFEKILVLKQQKKVKQKHVFETKDELNKLIGLSQVKVTLNRIVQRMKFDKARRQQGIQTSPIHTAAIFMGNPGTAKTTVARLFGQILCDEGVLNSYQFLEISRKDLIGKYVGHTAPNVANIFERAKGGTIFIDEAYSLMDSGRSDGFSDEALAEIIRQMENNPDTLVIFAGYTEEMKKFINNANTGLRSRLTNIIEFADYNNEEMLQIFTYFLEKEDYVLANPMHVKQMVQSFIKRMNALEVKNIGNGRLMRKLFNTAIAFKAERNDGDLKTLFNSDIENAIEELVSNELVINETNGRKNIGF